MVSLDINEGQESRLQFDGVDPGYQHYQKQIWPGAPVLTDEVALKWYDIGFADQPIAPERDLAARQFLAGQLADLAEEGSQLGFVIHHDCRSVVFLLVCLWRSNNELWERVYLQWDGESGFDAYDQAGSPRPAFCVWELEAVWHESKARTRYLLGQRTSLDREIWLSDMAEGLTPAT
ncbi:MAG TPA: hypothetical protein PK691_01625 [Thermomicrobiales bacterium]|nr:hypothetical protein [Thermomicrobiales bacterium]HRA49072.1 hypothetical protein [Thermomicrobiales bacterium]